jgi:hypothetical protein
VDLLKLKFVATISGVVHSSSVTAIGTGGFAGVTAIQTSAAVTLNAAVPKTESDVAVIVEVPVPLLVASPPPTAAVN